MPDIVPSHIDEVAPTDASQTREYGCSFKDVNLTWCIVELSQLLHGQALFHCRCVFNTIQEVIDVVLNEPLTVSDVEHGTKC